MHTFLHSSFMEIATIVLICIYALAAAVLLIYGVNCYVMIALFLRSRARERLRWLTVTRHERGNWNRGVEMPYVTTQLPLYNEANVAERIIRAVAAIDYPSQRHQIQVLDDSTDETRAVVDAVAAELISRGHDISVHRRTNRTGYKAGALREGLVHAKGNIISIFDADFIPPRDYLRKMVPMIISDDKLGFVQARWGHLNSSTSVLTRSQTLGIDGHFMVEQCARAYNGLFLNFNGTAGLWRREAIVDAGNWQDDTLTEDMDLSYRCQLAGWTATYVPDVIVPAELPESYVAFKNQQFRWAKGSIQTAIKIMPAVLRSRASAGAKLQAFMHMTHYVIHPLMAVMALLALPVLLVAEINLPIALVYTIAAGIVLATMGPSCMYMVSQTTQGSSQARRLWFLPVLMCVGVGIALSNSRAVFEAVGGIKSAFLRTPKSGSCKKQYKSKASLLPLFEVAMGLYCAFSFLVYIFAEKYLVGPFLLIYTLGFFFVGLNSLKEQWSDS